MHTRNVNIDEHKAALFEPLLQSAEAAALLGIHPKTLQLWARNGIVCGIRVGRKWNFRASVLEAFLRSRYTQSTIRAA